MTPFLKDTGPAKQTWQPKPWLRGEILPGLHQAEGVPNIPMRYKIGILRPELRDDTHTRKLLLVHRQLP